MNASENLDCTGITINITKTIINSLLNTDMNLLCTYNSPLQVNGTFKSLQVHSIMAYRPTARQ